MAHQPEHESLSERVVAYLYAKADLADFKRDLVSLVENGGCIDHHLFEELDPDKIVYAACKTWRALTSDEQARVRNRRSENILEPHVPESVRKCVRRRAVYNGVLVDPLIKLLIRARECSSAVAG